MTPLTFTPEELAILHRAAHAVWDFLAPTASTEAALPRKKVIDRVIASGRLEHAVRRQLPPASVVIKLRVCDDDTLVAALKSAFPLARYGPATEAEHGMDPRVCGGRVDQGGAARPRRTTAR